MMFKYKNEENLTIITVLDQLKQILAVKSNRLRRYRESDLRRKQNKLFQTNEKQFYRSIQNDNVQGQNQGEVPDAQEVNKYWRDIWTQSKQHNSNADWITAVKDECKEIPVMNSHSVDTEDVKRAIKKTMNWKGTGRDYIHNFWYKNFPSIHETIAELFTKALNNPEVLPPFLTYGLTYLIPKTRIPSSDPGKYRPITCLPTLYKLLTSILTDKIYKHLEDNNILSEEQKGCKRGSQGCKEQLIIDTAVCGHVKKTGGTLYTAYIDYQKAFDSIPHSWLIDVLDMYKIDPLVVSFLKVQMQRWTTRLQICTQNDYVNAGEINIKQGIFQGDSLSALWFCLAMNPLSTLLNRDQMGYKINSKNNHIRLSHLLYMDDLKLFSSTREKLNHLLDTTAKFSNDIGMQFGIEKCKLNAIRKGKWQHQMDYTLREGNSKQNRIQAMQPEEYYKYLGYLQNSNVDQKSTKTSITQEFNTRLKNILKTKLSAGRKFKAINTFVIPVLTYSFGIIKWTKTELEAFNMNCRVLCTKYRCHHPKSAVERFHLPRNLGGRGVTDIVNLHYQQLERLRQYFQEKANGSKIHQIVTYIDRKITPLNLTDEITDLHSQIQSNEVKIDNWKEKQLHGRYPYQIEGELMDRKSSIKWLCLGELFAETEGFIIAIQDQVVSTKNYRKFILKDSNILDDKCRLCRDHRENVDHIISGCSSLASSEYTKRHDDVCKVVHQQLCHNNNLLMGNWTPYYKYTPETVIDTNGHKMYWNRSIITDRSVSSNKPDIVWHDKKTKKVYLIDVAVPLAHNIQKKRSEKILKYQPLANEIKEMWSDVEKVTIVPIIVGATGEIPKFLQESLAELQLKKGLFIQLQKIVILHTCNIVRRFLSIDS